MKLRLIKFVACPIAFAIFILWPPMAKPQNTDISIQEARSLCHAMRNQYAREYAGREPKFLRSADVPADNSEFEFHDWAGVSVPIVPEHDGWRFAFHLNYTVLYNDNRKIEYMIRNSLHFSAGEVFLRMQENRNLPRPRYDDVDLLIAGLSIDPTQFDCNSGSAAEILEGFWAIGTKALAFKEPEVVVAHQGSLLTHRPFDYSSERWVFLARDEHSDSMKDISITTFEPEHYPQIGLRIGGSGGAEKRVTPSWLDQFFLTAAQPSRASFEALVEAVGDYPLPASVMELVDETLYSELAN